MTAGSAPQGEAHRRGLVVAIDGPDGAGKSTQARLLHEWLARGGVRSELVSKWDVLDPRHHPEARILRGTDAGELRQCVAAMPPLARPLFVLWLYAETAARAARLAHDAVVVLDGFWMKHAAAELAYGSDPRMVEAAVATLGPVDAVVYLDIEPEAALRRKQGALTPYECGLDARLDPRKFLEQQHAIRSRLLAWAERDGWLRVEAGPAEAVHRRVREIVAQLLTPLPPGPAPRSPGTARR